jgi:hypothetical protein
MIDLHILGGFLGAGKTSWLRHSLLVGQLGIDHILINEAAGIPVDNALLADIPDVEVKVLSGGCACCDAWPALRDALLGIADGASRDGASKHVLLETSGLADPGRISRSVLADPVLISHFRLAPVRVLVDALNGYSELRHEPLARAQVASADHLILTKADCVDAEKLSQLIHVLRPLAPAAMLSATVFGCEQPLPQLPHPAEPLPPLDPDLSSPVAQVLTLPAEANWMRFSVWLSALLHAHSVCDVMQQPEILPETAPATDNEIVLIGRGIAPDLLQRSFKTFCC